MKEEHIKANEKYFSNVIDSLAEGGRYFWIDMAENLIKKGNKLQVSARVYNQLQNIVSQPFLSQKIELLPE